MATRIAAVAVGLSLAGGMALAKPDGTRGNESTAVEQQGDQDRRDRGRKAKPAGTQPPAANQARRGMPETRARNERQRQGFERPRNRYEGNRNVRGRDNQLTDRARNNRDNRRNFGDRNDRRGWDDRARDSRDTRRTYGDRNDRRGWDDRSRRQQFNIRQYHRNFNAPRRYRADVYHWRNGNSYRRYGYGQRLPRHYFPRNFWIVNLITYDLFAPPPGYIWVRYGPDALLIDQYTGEIVQVRYGMFYS
ncbi:MAG: hypothetical protein HOP13_05925 [Alphaproteobacteria bacterium]|nr:hypothetical protein [Alphaproteobacteria bacterium]